MKLIAPSILSADFTCLGNEVRAVQNAGADWIHVDVMDGHFVPNITMGPLVVEAVRCATTLPIDVHLMIENPDHYIVDFAKAGADYISVHVETCVHLHRSIQLTKDQGAKAGVVLNPATPLSSIQWVLKNLDFVLLMSVNPGFGGQAFIPETIDKTRMLKAMLEEQGLDIPIQIDGGVNIGTINSIAQAGADVFVAGSAVFNTDDYAKAIGDLKTAIKV